MVSGFNVRIRATGVARPSRIVTSTQLDEMFGRAPGLSEKLSGVRERAWAEPGDASSALGADALGAALESSGLVIDDLDAILGASAVPEQPMPTTSVLIAERLGARGITCCDMNASCLSFLEALRSAAASIQAGAWQRVAIVSTEIASIGLWHDEVEISSLFGDGAAAVILEASDGDSQLLTCRTETYPDYAHYCEIRAGGTKSNLVTVPESDRDYFFRMNGLGIMRGTMRTMPAFLASVLESAGVSADELDLIVPHQASGLGLRYLREKLGFDDDRVVDILATHGNQVAASMPTALHYAVQRAERGDHILLIGTGAGLVVGGAVLRY